MPSVMRPSFDQLCQFLARLSIGPWSADWVSGKPCGQPQEWRARIPTSASADTDFGERADVRLRVRRAAHVVAPGMHEGHSGIDRLRGRESRALKDVIRIHLLAETRDGREIALLRLVAGETAVKRVPHMPMGLDQAGHDDHARAVDLLP